MVLQLKNIFSIPNESKKFDCEINAEKLEQYPYHSFGSPVTVSGTVSNRAGVVTLCYSCRFVADHVCDRCLCEFAREYSFSFEHTLVTEDSRYDDYVVCKDYALDMDELVMCDLLLELPTKILCREDCKGLCFKCGADLNKGECSCSHSN